MDKGYLGIYYDNFKNRLWFKGVGFKDYEKHDYKHEYYIECPEELANKTIKGLFGESVRKIYTEDGRVPKGIQNSSAKTFEATVPPAVKFLQDRYYGNKIEIDMNEINSAWIDIECGLYSLDGENTDPNKKGFPHPEEAEFQINLITVDFWKTGESHTFAFQEYYGPDLSSSLPPPFYKWVYHCAKSEKEMLMEFLKFFKKNRADLIIGYNSEGFDIPYIYNRCKRLFKEEDVFSKYMSPIPDATVKEKDRYNKVTHVTIKTYEIPGLASWDYMQLFLKFKKSGMGMQIDSYSLQNVGMVCIGEGKLELEGDINQIYRTDWDRFVQYNVQDVSLMIKIDNRLKLIKSLLMICYESLIPFQNIQSYVRIIEGDLLKLAREKNIVLPDNKKKADWWHDEKKFIVIKENGKIEYQNCKEGETDFEEYYTKGGHTNAEPGIYKFVLSYDFNSAYPNWCIENNLSPETKVTYKQLKIKPGEKGFDDLYIKSSIEGVYFKRDIQGLVAESLETYFNLRKKYKKKMAEVHKAGIKDEEEYWNLQQMNVKNKINAYYGALAMKGQAFMLGDVDNSRSITRGIRNLLRFCKQVAEIVVKENLPILVKEKWNLNVDLSKIKFTEPAVVQTDTDSVVGNSILNTKLGKIKIEELFDKSNLVINEGIDNYRGYFNKNITTYSMNKNGVIENNKILWCSKHKVKKELYEIEYNEKKVTMTSDHSIIIKRNNKIIDIKPEEIKENDEIFINDA